MANTASALHFLDLKSSARVDAIRGVCPAARLRLRSLTALRQLGLTECCRDPWDGSNDSCGTASAALAASVGMLTQLTHVTPLCTHNVSVQD
jgi:hypothetical protein